MEKKIETIVIAVRGKRKKAKELNMHVPNALKQYLMYNFQHNSNVLDFTIWELKSVFHDFSKSNLIHWNSLINNLFSQINPFYSAVVSFYVIDYPLSVCCRRPITHSPSLMAYTDENVYFHEIHAEIMKTVVLSVFKSFSINQRYEKQCELKHVHFEPLALISNVFGISIQFISNAQ